MNSEQLRAIVANDRNLRPFLQICAIDTLPDVIRNYPFGVIFNSDISSMPGRHWLGLYSTNGHTIEFFDSLGYDIEHYNLHLKQFITRHGFTYISNRIRVQSATSRDCGLYVLCFLLYRLIYKRSFSSFVRLFHTVNLHSNDCVVRNFLRRYFRVLHFKRFR